MHLAAFQDVFRGRGWTLDRAAYFDRYLGYDDRDLVETFARDAGLVLAAADIRHIVEEKTRTYEQRLIDGRVTYPTAAAAVARLGIPLPARHRVGVARRRDHRDPRPAGLDAAFGAIVGADSVARSKPAPDAYAAAVEQLGVRPEAARGDRGFAVGTHLGSPRRAQHDRRSRRATRPTRFPAQMRPSIRSTR